MDDSFARALDEWTAFYALMGGAAATLLGLLFVAVSLRLNIFRQRDVADVRDFAVFTFGTFLVTIMVAGLALAPHTRRAALALPILLAGIAGLALVAWVSSDWIRLNLSAPASQPGVSAPAWQGLAYMVVMAAPYVALIVVTVLLWRQHPDALGLLAVVEGWLLGMGTVAAWIMLSHAGRRGDSPSDAA
jgi:hypothetical protein